MANSYPKEPHAQSAQYDADPGSLLHGNRGARHALLSEEITLLDGLERAAGVGNALVGFYLGRAAVSRIVEFSAVRRPLATRRCSGALIALAAVIIGRGSCRESVWQYGEISVVAFTFKNKPLITIQ